MSQILNFELKDNLEKYPIYSLIITKKFNKEHFWIKKSSSGLVKKTKFHNLLNAATKPKTLPKDRNIP